MLEIFDSLCILLAKAEQKHFLYTKRALDEAKLELSPGQLVVLYALYKKDNISISELSKKIFLDNSTLTGLIDRLERVDLVKRVDVPHDRRSYQICLTDKARKIEQQTKQVMRDIEHKMLEDCSESEIATLRSVLGRIYANF